MSYDNRHVAVTFGEVKQAYLYFDFVVPVYLPRRFPGDVIPPRMSRKSTDESIGDIHPEIYARIGKKRIKILESNVRDFRDSQYGKQAIRYLGFAISELCRDLRKDGYRVVPIFDDEDISLNERSGLETLSVISSNVIDVDAERAEWEQLKEFKRDRSARRAARNYRLFWFKNYKGKERGFIEDDLGKRYDDFEAAVKKHGFEVFYTSAIGLMNSRSLLASITLSTASVLAGSPILAGGALTTGAIVEASKMTLTFAKKKLEQKEFMRGHDLLLLKMIKEEIGISNGVAGGFSPPAPTPPGKRLRTEL